MLNKNKYCLFCDLINNDGDYSFIADMPTGRLLVNYSQTYKGRCLYIYKEHVKDFTEIDPSDLQATTLELAAFARVLNKLYNPYIMNVASLGNEVPHLHWHLIPRYENENNFGKPPWPHEKHNVTPEECRAIANLIYDELKNYQDEKFIINETDENNHVLTLKLK